MALANVAVLLSQWGSKVLVVDWDLEAPGIERYFDDMIPGSSREVLDKNGIIEIVSEISGKDESHWKDSIIRLPVRGANRSLDFLSAGRRDSDYVERLQHLDWESLFQYHDFGSRLETLRNDWLEEYDHILIDSRTGITDIGGICTIYLPDVLVALFTANYQSVEGVADVISRVRRARSSLPVDRGALVCIPIPARDESRTEYQQSVKWRGIYHKLLSQLYVDFLPKNVSAVDALDLLRIPNVPFWSFGEKLPVLTESASDPSGITYYYTILARLLATDLSWQDSTPSQTAGQSTRVSVPPGRDFRAAQSSSGERVSGSMVEAWRVAQIVVDRGPDRHGSGGSGYLVAPGLVLTAAHVVAGARAVGVRLDVDQPTEIETSAEGWWVDPGGSDGTDLAVVAIPSEATAGRAVELARFGRIGDTTAVLAVRASGFPQFKMRASPSGKKEPRVFRDLDQVAGHAPVAANRRQGTLADLPGRPSARRRRRLGAPRRGKACRGPLCGRRLDHRCRGRASPK